MSLKARLAKLQKARAVPSPWVNPIKHETTVLRGAPSPISAGFVLPDYIRVEPGPYIDQLGIEHTVVWADDDQAEQT